MSTAPIDVDQSVAPVLRRTGAHGWTEKRMQTLTRQRDESGGLVARGAGVDVVRSRCRSFCFIYREGVRWTVFLVTYLLKSGGWRGYFAFRSAQGEEDVRSLEVRTADLFVEETEKEVDARARGLGRPLVLALLDSALDTQQRRRGFSPELHGWFRELLVKQAEQRPASNPFERQGDEPTLAELHSLYESYRVDQVAHMIALMDPEDFRELVEILLDGRRIDFKAHDRFQLAMSVIQDIERRLPLPPFEVWAEDYLAHQDEYRQYAHALHRSGEIS